MKTLNIRTLKAQLSAHLSLSSGKSTESASDAAKAKEREPQTDAEVFSQEELRPAGNYYESTIPDTLDLAERGRLAVRGLISFLDPSRSFEPYQIGRFNSQPAYMSHYGAVGCNWGKITEGILMTRHMSGSTENLAEEGTMFKGILALIRDNGEFAVETDQSWLAAIGRKSETLIPMNTSRMLIALMVQNQLRPSARLAQLIGRMADSICEAAKPQGDYAYLPAAAPRYQGEILGPWHIMIVHGTSLRGLCRSYTLTGDRRYLEFGDKFKNVLLKPEYWVPEAAPKAVMGGEHGEFDGHIHAYTAALMGLLWYASLTNDSHLKEFVREGYEFIRTFGIARIGMFGEMCVTGDMTWLAIKLSDLGVGDYWEDVDCYVRNHMVEQQCTDAEEMHKVNASMPKLVEMANPEYAKRGFTTDHVIDRFVGAWRSDASNPAMIHPQNFLFVVCCSGNNPPALYAAWEGTVRYNAGIARVNLLLNRASPWLDMDSYLPYEGKVVIRNKAAKELFVRIPRWVDQGKVSVEVNGKTSPRAWLGRSLFLDGLRAGDEIRIDFPVVESKETYTLKWRPEDRWLEVANPGYNWKPHDPPESYAFLMKGNTVVDVSPRTAGVTASPETPQPQDVMNTVAPVKPPAQGSCYPLYMRDYYQRVKAPMKQVRRYVSPVTVKW